MPRRVFGYLLVMILLWGSHSAVVRLSLAKGENSLSRQAFLFSNLLWASAGLLSIIAATGRMRFLRLYRGKRLVRMVFTGVFGYFLYYFFLFGALQRAPEGSVIEVNVLNYLFPICTMLASAAILRERLSVRGIISAFMAFFGAYVVMTGGALTEARFRHPDVDALAIAAAASWGVFSALGRRWRYEALTGMLVFVLTGLVITACFLPFVQGRIIPRGWEIYGSFHVGFLCNTLAVMLWFAALRAGGSMIVGNLTQLTAFVSVVFIWLLVGEPIGAWAMAGLVIITGAVFLGRSTPRIVVGPEEEVPSRPS